MTNVLDTIAEAIAEVIEPSPKEAPEESNASKPLPPSTDTIDSREYNVSPDYPIQADSTTISGITGYVPKRLIDKAQPVIDLSRISGDFRFNAKINNFIDSYTFSNSLNAPLFQLQNIGTKLIVITSIQCSQPVGFGLIRFTPLLPQPSNLFWLDYRFPPLVTNTLPTLDEGFRVGITSGGAFAAGPHLMFSANGIIELGDSPIILQPLPNVALGPFLPTLHSDTLGTGAAYKLTISFRGYTRPLLDKDLIQ